MDHRIEQQTRGPTNLAEQQTSHQTDRGSFGSYTSSKGKIKFLTNSLLTNSDLIIRYEVSMFCFRYGQRDCRGCFALKILYEVLTPWFY